MNCRRCDAALPESAAFCGRCGTPAGAEGGRRGFAVNPGESVLSFNVVTSIMPLASGQAPQTYRWALAAGAVIPLVAGALGFLPMAFAAAAALVPAVYLVYLYDVNQWEDQPVPVVAGTVLAAGVLSLGFTLLWQEVFVGDGAGPVARDLGSSIDGGDLLVYALVVPVGVWLLGQLGPLWLAAKPRFDDLIDGLTFGIAAGVAFAAVETLVVNRSVFLDGPAHIDDPDAALWLSLLFTAALVKPLVYGSAIGIAAGSFSGLGAGYDGFGPGYARGAIEALVALVAYGAGEYLLGLVEGSSGAVLGLLWGLLVAGMLMVRVRLLLQHALLEAALDAEEPGEPEGHCPTCEMPLLRGAAFCVACGTGLRAGTKRVRGASADRPGHHGAEVGA